MKRLFIFVLLFGMLVAFGLGTTNPARGSISTPPEPDADYPGSGMPG